MSARPLRPFSFARQARQEGEGGRPGGDRDFICHGESLFDLDDQTINTTFFSLAALQTHAIVPTLRQQHQQHHHHPHRHYRIYYLPSPVDVSAREDEPHDSGASPTASHHDDDDNDINNDHNHHHHHHEPPLNLRPRGSRRSLTHPLHVITTTTSHHAMHPAVMDESPVSMPGSPPDLTSSKSSKSSSFHSSSSYPSDEGSILADVSHFEDIGLDDDARSDREGGDFDLRSPNPYTTTFASDLRGLKRPAAAPRRHTRHTTAPSREWASLTIRTPHAGGRGQSWSPAVDPPGAALRRSASMPRKAITTTTVPSPATPIITTTMSGRRRSRSPQQPLNLHNLSAARLSSAGASHSRAESWSTSRERKTQRERERECDEEDGDDVPDDCLLENVPISPRPLQARPRSPPPSPDRGGERKDKARSLGHGTSPVPVEQGSLRSVSSPAKPGPPPRGLSMGDFPLHHDPYPLPARARSWTAVLSDLSEEAKALTEALEVHADAQLHQQEQEQQHQDPTPRRSHSASRRSSRERARVRSLAELPPLRRTNIMIDPLPISKEKEAVLSRTRPSWLPPKDPHEERRHLREYQRMMAAALEAERRKEVQTHQRMACRDDTASSLLRIWEEHVLPNWDAVTGQKRTRELWWRGIAPRSRGAVWQRAVGNELELTDASYRAALLRAKALERQLAPGGGGGTEDERRKGGWFTAIRRDVSGTYPELRIFQRGGPLCEPLVDVLMAYAMYRSDVGYVSGTNTIAALLLLNLPTPQRAFVTLANILNRALPLSFHTLDQGATSRVHAITLATLAAKLPRLHAHLCASTAQTPHPEEALWDSDFAAHPAAYLTPFFASLFTSHLDLDSVTRLWDVWVFEGDAVLVRAAVAFFAALEPRLYGVNRKEEILKILGGGIQGGEEGWMRLVRDAGRSDRGAVSPYPTGDGAGDSFPR